MTPSPGNAEALAAIAAITGQSLSSATEMFRAARTFRPDEALADPADVQRAVDRLCTRVGLAPALTHDHREHHIRTLRELVSGSAPR